MPNLTQEELVKITDEAFATRLAGNELLKQGDYQGALTSYHTVLLRLKGVSRTRQTRTSGAVNGRTGSVRACRSSAAVCKTTQRLEQSYLLIGPASECLDTIRAVHRRVKLSAPLLPLRAIITCLS